MSFRSFMRREHILRFLLSSVGVTLFALAADAQGISRIYGLDFSPYENGQDPNLGSQLTASQILSRMQIVAPYITWVRSFSSSNGLQNIPSAARQLGLKVAANAWISADLAQNTVEINNLIIAANLGLVDIAIVGSEAILRNDVTERQLIAYMNQVRESIPSRIPVTTADVYGTFLAHPNLIAASDVLFANFYPYWEGTSIDNALCSLQQEYQHLVSVSGTKTVWISETGWPSQGNAVGAAVPSPANAALYALQFFSWASVNSIPALYFEAFDEAWKAGYEGPQGAHWGLFDASGTIKPGMDAFFNGQTATLNCNGMIPGPIGISFTYVPPYRSADPLEVAVTGVRPADYAVATYIFIGVLNTWWTKPTQAQPTVSINPDGTARISIDTGGIDTEATAIAAFLIPSTVTPPIVLGGALPSIPSAVASIQVQRTESSISGIITDSQSNPISGATVSDATLGSTTSGPDGKYSFYNINTPGTATLTVSYPNYIFPGSPATVSISSGNQQVTFVGKATVDLAVTASVAPTPIQPGSKLVVTIVASNAGVFAASDAVVTVPIPKSFTLISASTTRGNCDATSVQVACDVGGLAPTAYATITLTAVPDLSGSFSLSASITGPEPDPNQTNNNVDLAVTVLAAQVGANRTFVSTIGNDSNTSVNCSALANCRTLAAALAVTNAGGEIVMLNSGGYGSATITQPVTITADGVDASISETTPGANALTINTPGDVTITGVNLHGGRTGNNGILVQQVGFLRVYNVLIESFAAQGVDLEVSGNLVIDGSTINDNGGAGVFVSNASASAYVHNTSFDHNSSAVQAAAGQASVADSSAENNVTAFLTQGGSLALVNDRATFNSTAMSSVSGGMLFFTRCLISNNSTAYNVASGSTIAGSSPGTSLIAPGQGTTGTLSTPVAVQ